MNKIARAGSLDAYTLNQPMKKHIEDFPKPSKQEALNAIKTMIAWAGDNPNREGLIDTPQRVVNAYQEFFSGYDLNPDEILSRTFEEIEGYDEMVIVKNIRVESHCEHHMVPIIGKADIAYIPDHAPVAACQLPRVRRKS